MKNIDPTICDVYDRESDEALVNQNEDKFLKVLADCEFGIDAEAIAEETAGVHRQIETHYRKLAEAVVPVETVTNDPAVLRKRWSVDERSGYREYFKTHIAKGKTPQAILDGWLAEFPTANPDCAALMRAVAAEFV